MGLTTVQRDCAACDGDPIKDVILLLFKGVRVNVLAQLVTPPKNCLCVMCLLIMEQIIMAV